MADLTSCVQHVFRGLPTNSTLQRPQRWRCGAWPTRCVNTRTLCAKKLKTHIVVWITSLSVPNHHIKGLQTSLNSTLLVSLSTQHLADELNNEMLTKILNSSAAKYKEKHLLSLMCALFWLFLNYWFIRHIFTVLWMMWTQGNANCVYLLGCLVWNRVPFIGSFTWLITSKADSSTCLICRGFHKCNADIIRNTNVQIGRMRKL